MYLQDFFLTLQQNLILHSILSLESVTNLKFREDLGQKQRYQHCVYL